MSLEDSSKQERVEEFLRKSLLGEEVINTQFHLFSARSVPFSRLTKPRVLCANNVLLAKSSKYFLDLLSSDISPADPSLSDLDDDDEEPRIPLADTEPPKVESATVSTTPPKIRVTTQPKDDDELSEDGSESDSSDMFVMSPEHPRTDEPFGILNMGEAGSVTSGETSVLESQDHKGLGNQQLRSLGSRHVLVKDIAFQTWYTLLNYLYTDKVNFLPLGSATPGGQHHAISASPADEPRCSAKSMYRLACKVGIDRLRDEALAHIRSNLAEHNILTELSCSIVASYPQLLEMELDVLYAHIESAPVVTGFPALAKRIAHKELLHGADIIVGIHKRLLKERQTLQSAPTLPPIPPPHFSLPAPSSPPVAVTANETIENDTVELLPTSSDSWGVSGWGWTGAKERSALNGCVEPQVDVLEIDEVPKIKSGMSGIGKKKKKV